MIRIRCVLITVENTTVVSMIIPAENMSTTVADIPAVERNNTGLDGYRQADKNAWQTEQYIIYVL